MQPSGKSLYVSTYFQAVACSDRHCCRDDDTQYTHIDRISSTQCKEVGKENAHSSLFFELLLASARPVLCLVAESAGRVRHAMPSCGSLMGLLKGVRCIDVLDWREMSCIARSTIVNTCLHSEVHITCPACLVLLSERPSSVGRALVIPCDRQRPWNTSPTSSSRREEKRVYRSPKQV